MPFPFLAGKKLFDPFMWAKLPKFGAKLPGDIRRGNPLLDVDTSLAPGAGAFLPPGFLGMPPHTKASPGLRSIFDAMGFDFRPRGGPAHKLPRLGPRTVQHLEGGPLPFSPEPPPRGIAQRTRTPGAPLRRGDETGLPGGSFSIKWSRDSAPNVEEIFDVEDSLGNAWRLVLMDEQNTGIWRVDDIQFTSGHTSPGQLSVGVIRAIKREIERALPGVMGFRGELGRGAFPHDATFLPSASPPRPFTSLGGP